MGDSKCVVDLSLVVLALNKVFFFRILSVSEISEWDNEDKMRTLGSEMGREYGEWASKRKQQLE